MSHKSNFSRKSHSIKRNTPVTFLPELLKATGKCDYPMTNDYIFRAVLQTNNLALKGLISSLLHILPKQILSVDITNPIALGDSYSDKECRLDINVVLNNHTLINLEMQMEWQDDWHDRSLVYLCRNFDTLSKGQEYSDTKPTIHIGIQASAPAKEGNEFYSEHKMINVKTLKVYSDKVSLHVLNLRQIKRATEEDKAWGIDLWAKLFKAATWEELRMIAQNNEYLTATANSIFLQNADDLARKRALDREEHYRDLRTWQRDIDILKAENAEQAASLAEKDASLAEKDASLAEKDASLAEKDASLAEKDALIAELQAKLAEKNNS